jgi:hypothetical protein
MDGEIYIFKFDPRWYHHQPFYKLFPNMATVFPFGTTSEYMYISPNVPGGAIINTETENYQFPLEFGNDMDQSDHRYPGWQGDQLQGDQIYADYIIDLANKENSTPRMAHVSNTVKYQHIQEKLSELARTC